MRKKKTGFTLIELLVVMSIMGILTIISLASFVNAQVKARDSQRKTDLDGIKKALMMYFNDSNVFPTLVPFGNEQVGFTGKDGIIYMRKVPLDPKNNNGWPPYVYEVSPSGKSFNLFANLENENDSQCTGAWLKGGETYCYGVASPNTIVGETLP